MSTHTPTLDDFPTHLRESIEAFTAGFLATVTDRDQITPDAVGAAMTRESQRVTRLAFDRRHPGRDALTGALSGTYDEFRGVWGMACWATVEPPGRTMCIANSVSKSTGCRRRG